MGRLTLDQPDRLNPLSARCLSELIDAAHWFDERSDVKVVVVEGAGRSFTAGADVSGIEAGATTGTGGGRSGLRRDGTDLGRRMADAVEAMTAVTVARLHGYCVGGGVVLAAVCDMRVAADDAVFFIPEVDLGIPLGWGGIPRLVREIGPAMTRELVLTCRRFGAAEAKAIGFLNRVVPPGELDSAVDDLVANLVDKSALTLTVTKQQVRAAAEEMASTAHSFVEADLLIAAFGDDESLAVGRRYIQRLRERRGDG